MDPVSWHHNSGQLAYTKILADIAKASVAADRIIEMRAKNEVKGTSPSLDRGGIADNDSGVKVEFRNVHFRYPTRDVPVLNGLDLTVRICFYSEMRSV